MAFVHAATLRLRHTDCAGVIFFPRLLELAHEAYEALLDEAGVSLADGIAGDGPLLPIVRCEADYSRPVRLGDRLRIEVLLEREGRSSFTLGYRFTGEDGEERARARTVHVAMDRETGASAPLTDGMRAGLAALRGMDGPVGEESR